MYKILVSKYQFQFLLATMTNNLEILSVAENPCTTFLLTRLEISQKIVVKNSNKLKDSTIVICF